VQKMKISVNGGTRSARVCTKCLKAGKVQKV
jgi:ribosomal protein L28